MSSFQRCSPRNLRDYQIFSKLMIFFVRVATRVQKAPITVPKENYEITRPPFDAPGHTEFRSSPLDASEQNLVLRIRNETDGPQATTVSPFHRARLSPPPLSLSHLSLLSNLYCSSPWLDFFLVSFFPLFFLFFSRVAHLRNLASFLTTIETFARPCHPHTHSCFLTLAPPPAPL